MSPVGLGTDRQGFAAGRSPGSALGRLTSRLGQPVIREAIRAAMQWMADQFVMGRQLRKPCAAPNPIWRKACAFPSICWARGRGERKTPNVTCAITNWRWMPSGRIRRGIIFRARPGISVKLSALHPRYEMAQRERVLAELAPRLASLCEHAAHQAMTVTIDAEEAERLHLSVEVIAEHCVWRPWAIGRAWALRCRPMTNARRR